MRQMVRTYIYKSAKFNDGSEVSIQLKVGENGNVIELDGKRFDVSIQVILPKGFKVINKSRSLNSTNTKNK